MNREIATTEKGIVELIRMLAEKKLLIPPFQREFVWEPEDVLKLWDSLYRFYPIGSLLSWESPVYLRIHRRAGGHILPGAEGAGRPVQEVAVSPGWATKGHGPTGFDPGREGQNQATI